MVTDSTIDFIVQELARQAQMHVVDNTKDPRLAKRVTVNITRMNVLDALAVVLKGTGLELLIRPSGQLVIVAAGSETRRSMSGMITGNVVDAATHRALVKATVSVQGTKRSAVTNSAGVYVLPDVPAGRYRLTVRLLGYSAMDRAVTVRGNDTVTVSFALSSIPVRLQDVVTTGAGDRKRLEVGNSVATIDAASIVSTSPIRNLSDLLDGRAPGVQVSSTSGAVGSGSQIRIRGVASLLASSDPIVIIDGVRVDAGFSQAIPGAASANPIFGSNDPRAAAVNQQTGAPATSRLNDIDPETIEKVEVLKGPSAATLYGSDAANGVIVVTTKRGRAGPTRWSFFGQHGMSRMDATFPEAWYGWGTSNVRPDQTACALQGVGSGFCTQDSVTHYNPLNHAVTTPLGTGYTDKYGVQVSGGNAQLQYFLGGDYDNEIGLERLDAADASQFLALRNGTPLPDWVTRPNALDALHLTSKLTAQLTPTADVALSTNFIHQYHRDDASNSFILQSLVSAGYRDSVNLGWGDAGSPGRNFLIRSSDILNRGSGGLSGNWHPTTHMSGRGTIGVDYSDRTDDGLRPSNIIPGITGSRAVSDMTTMVRTLDVGTTLDLPLRANIHARSTIGGQYTRTDNTGITVTAQGLADGSDIVNNATTRDASEFNSALAVAGWYLEQMIALNDAFFLTAAIRGDASSSFGSAAKTVYYPKLSASWLLSSEPFFPHIPAMNSFRVRSAFGHAGVQPTVDARFRSYKTSDGFVDSTSVPGIIVTTVGNPQLRPERSTEWEGGFDVDLLANRLSAELTTYRKITRDALITRDLPPSLGLASRQENLGKVGNQGLEISATARPIVSRMLDWTIILGFSQNRNRLLTLGPTTLPAIISYYGTNQNRYVVGYPLNGFWDRPILGYTDVNHDGVIESSEVRLGDSALYRGQPFPKAEVSWRNDMSFFSGWLSIGTSFNYTGGLTQLDAALFTQCQNGRCQQLQDPSTSLASQAYAVASLGSGVGGSTWGFLETVSYLRLSELSATLSVPQRISRRLGARATSISVMGRNLGLWTKYHGADPEVNTNVFSNQIVDDGGVPQPRDWSVRVNLEY